MGKLRGTGPTKTRPLRPLDLDGPGLKAWRERLGLSQNDLAMAVDANVNTISRWERGDQPITHPSMLMWALRGLENELTSRTITIVGTGTIGGNHSG